MGHAVRPLVFAAVLAVAVAGVAHASPPPAAPPSPRPVLRIAADPESFAPRTPLVWTDLRAALGAAFTEGLAPGGTWRLEQDLLLAPPTSDASFVAAMSAGLDGWGDGAAYGIGMPASLWLGAWLGDRDVPLGVVLRGGIGASLFVVDSVDHVAGGAVYAPHALVGAALDAGTVTFGVEARVAYRWLWVLEDRTQLCLTATVGFPTARQGRADAEPAP
ncbi:MAG: hypothetical protein IT373_25295 [Polyangiaceae bacterium]|nr:hypothetical protein [Polyangiaceae bacterium]